MSDNQVVMARDLSGTQLTRGEHGVVARRAYRVIFDAAINGWRQARQTDLVELTSWGVWDPDFGWQVGDWE